MDNEVSRRDFLRCACSGALVAALGLHAAGCDTVDDPPGTGGGGNGTGVTISGNTITVDLAQNAALAGAGGHLKIPQAGVIAINAAGTIRAFTITCTHEGCPVSGFSNNRIRCDCHGSQFDANGQVVQGPATAPLRQYTVSREGDVVTITKS